MPVKDEDRMVVEKVFQAMHAGPEGGELMASLYAEDAVMVEPFSGKPNTLQGKEAIVAFYGEAVKNSPPDMKVTLDRLDMDQDKVRAEWTCTSSTFPKPMRGYDLYRIVDSKIQYVEVVVTEMPPMGG